MMEMVVGGSRYEMVELPDSMVETTIYVGNLCEFVTDDMLSSLFQQVSSLNFVPACVARKPNFSSMQYGFVTFPSVEEKEVGFI
jgi:RNA recognition motif-containing protein